MLPGAVLEAATTARLVDDHVVVYMPKQRVGDVFERLDLLTSLLQPSGEALKPPRPLIEDFQAESTFAYGFYGTFSDFLSTVLDEFPDLVDLPRPDATPVSERRRLREFNENAVFSLKRFRSDAIEGADDDVYREAMRYTPWWEPRPVDFTAVRSDEVDFTAAFASVLAVSPASGPAAFVFGATSLSTATATAPAEPSYFTEAETAMMGTQLKRKEAPAGFARTTGLLRCLDVLVAYAYELRACAGDLSCESAYSMRVLSSTLSWLDVFATVDDVVVAFARRALCFPYLRRWDLALQAMRDAEALLRAGVRPVVRAALRVHEAFRKSETLYLHTKLYLADLCGFAQTMSANEATGLAADVEAWVRRVGGTGVVPPPAAVGGWQLNKHRRADAGLAVASQDDVDYLESLD